MAGRLLMKKLVTEDVDGDIGLVKSTVPHLSWQIEENTKVHKVVVLGPEILNRDP